MKLKIPENLTQQAYRSIRDSIIWGKIDNREHLTEEFFASRFGISKSPIREALNRLESEGLITIIPRRGAFVRDFSIQDVEEIFELREALEPLVIRNLTLNSKLVAQLQKCVRAAADYRKKNNKVNYIREDAAFHSILAQASNNMRLKKILENMHNQMLVLRSRTFELTSHSSIQQHLAVLNALSKRQVETAEQMMAEHIRTVRARLLEQLTKQNKQGPSNSRLGQGA
ncbi:MAG TPA: GntR family transcriptional regulator [Terriglobia bacterium]|nr:GntR family transcriptional regulator [Terriglobia bacterium]